jgi:hypothetical protein
MSHPQVATSEPCHFFSGEFARQKLRTGMNPQRNPSVFQATDKSEICQQSSSRIRDLQDVLSY